MPANVELDGTYNGALTAHTIFNVPSAQPGVYLSGQAATIHGITIQSANAATARTNSGIYVINQGIFGPVVGGVPTAIPPAVVYDVDVSGFERGIYVNTISGNPTGNVTIESMGFNSLFHNNTYGMQIDNGGFVIAEDMDSGNSTTTVAFNTNTNDGILCINGSLSVKGQHYTGTNTNTYTQSVRADYNLHTGVYIESQCKLTADHLGAGLNSASGLAVSNAAQTAKVTNSSFNSNTGDGLHIFNSTATGPGHRSGQFRLRNGYQHQRREQHVPGQRRCGRVHRLQKLQPALRHGQYVEQRRLPNGQRWRGRLVDHLQRRGRLRRCQRRAQQRRRHQPADDQHRPAALHSGDGEVGQRR